MTAAAQYSRLDRLLYRAAFAGIGLQKVVADFEDSLFRADLAAIEPGSPVFVSSLPRAGTTLVLELIAKLPAFASHTYRQMPFLLIPMLYEKVSRDFRREAELAERAHGDNVLIGFDSPEAFEEAVWKAWWSGHYKGGRIARWSADTRDEEFERFLTSHMRKIVAIRRRSEPAAQRYLSKNNGNIARLRLLERLFPAGRIVVPVRDPLAHVVSLHRQHLRFAEMHAADPFGRDYMRACGHFDFGDNLMPIDFGRERGGPQSSDGAGAPGFWLDYWIAAFSALREEAGPQVLFLGYEELCASPEPSIERLLAHIGESAPGRVTELAQHVREGVPKPPKDPGLDPARLAEAREIHRSLTGR